MCAARDDESSRWRDDVLGAGAGAGAGAVETEDVGRSAATFGPDDADRIGGELAVAVDGDGAERAVGESCAGERPGYGGARSVGSCDRLQEQLRGGGGVHVEVGDAVT